MDTLFMLNCPYWEEIDKQEAKKAKNFTELSKIAIRILHKMKLVNPDITMLAGPMWSGPLGVEENHRRFEAGSKALVQSSYHLFRQMPFQDAMKRIQQTHGYQYPNKELLEEFYGVIFATGLIKKIAFIPGYSLSYGALWEYNNAPNHGIICKVLPGNYIKILSSGKKIKGL
jgi:hypothetical protein